MQIPPENYPEEYIQGYVHFFGRNYRVTPDVLIPRLETECLVRRARKIIQENNITQVIDIGSGSGIIGTSIADLTEEIIFLDISSSALQITEENFKKNYPNKKAQYILSDLLSNFECIKIQSKSPILFVTNLPYIRDADWKNMSPDTIYEPKIALFGGEKTGFELYEKLFKQLEILSNSLEGFPIICVFEFGFDQREIAEKILHQYPNWKYNFFADYAGIERFGEIIIS